MSYTKHEITPASSVFDEMVNEQTSLTKKVEEFIGVVDVLLRKNGSGESIRKRLKKRLKNGHIAKAYESDKKI